jgi:hypothetical protein
MKRFISLLIILTILTGCTTSDTKTSLTIPDNCESTKVLAAFPETIPNPRFIDTAWEPAEGTDLYAALNNEGIACTFGIQEAEIGATILWTPDASELFDSRAQDWLSFGQKEIDLPNLDEDSAFVLTEGVEGKGEYHLWTINLLINGVWIQVNATFFNSLEAAMPIVSAAANSLVETALSNG